MKTFNEYVTESREETVKKYQGTVNNKKIQIEIKKRRNRYVAVVDGKELSDGWDNAGRAMEDARQFISQLSGKNNVSANLRNI